VSAGSARARDGAGGRWSREDTREPAPQKFKGGRKKVSGRHDWSTVSRRRDTNSEREEKGESGAMIGALGAPGAR
jgi:hypothetical protein